MNKYYYTFAEALKRSAISPFTNPFEATSLTNQMAIIASTITTEFDLDYEDFDKTLENQSYIRTLLNDYLWKKYRNEPVLILNNPKEEHIKEDGEEWLAWLAHFCQWLNESFERYSVLINLYNTNKDKLLNRIKSNLSNKFNDTPQNSGSFEDDTHNTNISLTESETDINQPMILRLTEINNNLVNLYEEWSKEFGNKFIIWSAGN